MGHLILYIVVGFIRFTHFYYRSIQFIYIFRSLITPFLFIGIFRYLTRDTLDAFSVQFSISTIDAILSAFTSSVIIK